LCLSPLPSESLIEKIYSEEYFCAGAYSGYVNYAGNEALHRKNANRRLDQITKAPQLQQDILLDVGCGLGFLMSEAANRGLTVFGTEISNWARNQAMQRTGFKIFQNIHSATENLSAQVDVVTMIQVLEHICDPAEALRQASLLLQPGGNLLIETWDVGSLVAKMMRSNWQQVSPPSVLHLFSRHGLVQGLYNAGFEITDIRTASKSISVDWVLGLLEGKYPPVFRKLRSIAKTTRLDGMTLKYKLGDLITVMAHRL
jgi:SAM-dependent methyltransferase